MSSKAITEKQREERTPGDWQPLRETAPSMMRDDEPQVARFIGMAGLFLVVLAVAVFVISWAWPNRPSLIPVGLARFLLVVGIGSLLFHAASDRELQIRRSYGFLGVLLLIGGIVFCLVPKGGVVGGYFGYGFFALAVALLFLIAFVRSETDVQVRDYAAYLLGAAGGVGALVGFIMGHIYANFLLPYGMLLAGLALCYLWAFLSFRGMSDELGYKACMAVGAVGMIVFLVALLRATLQTWGVLGPRYGLGLVPSALTLMTLGGLYGMLSLGLSSENKTIAIARRELAAYFYSPIAYIVLVSFTFVAWVQFSLIFSYLIDPTSEHFAGVRNLFEPIVRYYFIQFLPVLVLIGGVPLVTMHLLSEERRTGTYEMLLTTPLNEATVVVGKFAAALIFFLLCWVPFFLMLVAMRLETGQKFDYHPLFSFVAALVCSGAGFVGLGLFFSALTRSQIAAGALTFTAMAVLTLGFYLIPDGMRTSQFGNTTEGQAVLAILDHVNFINLWIQTLDGALVGKYLLINLSFAVFWLFATVKVLESRRWL